VHTLLSEVVDSWSMQKNKKEKDQSCDVEMGFVDTAREEDPSKLSPHRLDELDHQLRVSHTAESEKCDNIPASHEVGNDHRNEEDTQSVWSMKIVDRSNEPSEFVGEFVECYFSTSDSPSIILPLSLARKIPAIAKILYSSNDTSLRAIVQDGAPTLQVNIEERGISRKLLLEAVQAENTQESGLSTETTIETFSSISFSLSDSDSDPDVGNGSQSNLAINAFEKEARGSEQRNFLAMFARLK